MPLTIPTRKQNSDQIGNYVRSELPQIDPSTSRRSYTTGIVKSLASMITDWFAALKRYGDREPFPQTATGAFLTRGWWRDLTKLSKNPAAPAHGFLCVTGSVDTILDIGTTFQGANNVTYTTVLGGTIVTQALAIDSLTYDAGSGLCVLTTRAANHYLGTGMSVTIAGFSQSQYNGTFEITVTDDDDFTYKPASAPGVTPATGPGTLTATFAAIEVEADTSGQITNVDSGQTINITSNIAISEAIVTFGAVAGGTDLESDDDYRARVIEALGTDFGMFSEDEIKIVAKQVPGVTRVFVRTASVDPAPGWPLEGQVKIAFLRDNDANPLPTSQEVADVRARILSLELPAHTAEEDIIIMSPPPFQVDFAFSAITPDTPGMRRAIAASLKQFFVETAEWGSSIATLDYQCAILTAYDFETRQKLKSFTLTTPTGDLVPGVTVDYDYDDYAILGTVTFG